MNKLQLQSAITQSKNLESSIRIFVSESYHYSLKDTFNKPLRLATTLLSNVIPLKYLVKEYFYNPELYKQFDDISDQIFHHIDMIEEALQEILELGLQNEEEFKHVYSQFNFTRNLYCELLAEVYEEEAI
ncbi:hypothetical protein [Cytobacillus gottheilii]|uniref:hypothetical protein n=1 Tax=Cytobacillus gottheilii TaxID=859144 RepID=UPI000831F31C|nr:hypothetical protein [Cytobacillus gottheilii]